MNLLGLRVASPDFLFANPTFNPQGQAPHAPNLAKVGIFQSLHEQGIFVLGSHPRGQDLLEHFFVFGSPTWKLLSCQGSASLGVASL